MPVGLSNSLGVILGAGHAGLEPDAYPKRNALWFLVTTVHTSRCLFSGDKLFTPGFPFLVQAALYSLRFFTKPRVISGLPQRVAARTPRTLVDAYSLAFSCLRDLVLALARRKSHTASGWWHSLPSCLPGSTLGACSIAVPYLSLGIHQFGYR